MNYLEKKKYNSKSEGISTSFSILCSPKRNGLSFAIDDRKVFISDKEELLKIAEYIKFHAENNLNGHDSTGIGVSIVSIRNGRISSREIFDGTFDKNIDEYTYKELSDIFGTKDEIIVLFPLYDGAISRDNIVKSIMKCIELQRDFVMSGSPSDCRQMVLNDVKDETGLDVTMISRSTKNVRIYTPRKIFTLDARGGDLKLPSLFDEGISLKDFGAGQEEPTLFDCFSGDNSQKVARIEVLDIINNMIINENHKKPLTDDEISEELQRKGYSISRRTVAKYRETFLGHKNSGKRRES